MTWHPGPLEAKCETCGKRHGSPMCPPVTSPANPCPACGGDGEEIEQHDFTSRVMICSACRGSGKAAP